MFKQVKGLKGLRCLKFDLIFKKAEGIVLFNGWRGQGFQAASN